MLLGKITVCSQKNPNLGVRSAADFVDELDVNIEARQSGEILIAVTAYRFRGVRLPVVSEGAEILVTCPADFTDVRLHFPGNVDPFERIE